MAGRNNRVRVVEFLLPEAIKSGDMSHRELQACGAAHAVLNDAAGNGQLEVVKCVVKHANENGYEWRFLVTSSGSEALARAITGKHAGVVDYLLQASGFRWNLVDAFEAAVVTDNEVLVEKIYELFSQREGDFKLFIELAWWGKLRGVQYLYRNGYASRSW